MSRASEKKIYFLFRSSAKQTGVKPIFNHLTHREVISVSEIKRKKNESFESFFRRVKTQWQRSGKILQAKKIQFFTPKKSKNSRRKFAVNKSQLISKTNYLRKIGRLSEEEEGYDKKNKMKK